MTDNRVSVLVLTSDVGSMSRVNGKSAPRSVGRPRSVLRERFQEMDSSVGQMCASISSFMARILVDRASASSVSCHCPDHGL